MTTTEVMNKEQQLFSETIQLTGVKEYGYSWKDLTENNQPIPPEGARFDIYFEGEVFGDRVNGKIKGVDYLEVSPDGKFHLTLYASIATGDGADIKVLENGFNDQGELKLNMRFHTSDERYRWLNGQMVLGLGTVDFATGQATVKGYLI